jgi:uncharacterized caspase-like protein
LDAVFAVRIIIVLISLGFAFGLNAEPAEKRIALVIGNAAYQTGALPTSANDAGLIAQTLQAAGFDVVGARDLDQDSLRRALREFLQKATNSGPGTVAFVYLSGYAVQLEGENYFLPVDAKIGRDSDLAAEAVRVSDYIRPLGALNLKASVVVLDAARKNPFSIVGAPLAGGLALIEPSAGTLVAFNAAPGTVAPEQSGPYGAYAKALAEMMREGGLSLRDVFDRVRLRVNDMTKGAQVPWNSAKAEASFVFFERAADAPAVSTEEVAAVHARALRDLGAPDAFHAALERDTLEAYEEFIAAYPADPMTKRVRAIIASRREAVTWAQTYEANTPEAYWSYLTRYPNGPHAADARRRLANRAFAADPPASFTPIDYSVAPPPSEEMIFVRRPMLDFDDPYFDFAPPPPLPVYFLPPPPPDFIVLLAPPPPIGLFVLPSPIFVPIPLWCHHPAYLLPPPRNVIFNNIHNTVVINNVTNAVTIKNQNGHVISSKPGFAPGGQPLGTPLPPALTKAALSQPQKAGVTSAIPERQTSKLPLGQHLPSMNGHAQPQEKAGVTSAIPERQTSKLPFGQHLPSMNGHAKPQAPGKPVGAVSSGRTTAAVQKFHAPARSPSAPQLAHRALPPTQMHHSPSPPSVHRSAVATAVRSPSPPAGLHRAAPAVGRPAPAAAKKPGQR